MSARWLAAALVSIPLYAGCQACSDCTDYSAPAVEGLPGSSYPQGYTAPGPVAPSFESGTYTAPGETVLGPPSGAQMPAVPPSGSSGRL